MSFNENSRVKIPTTLQRWLAAVFKSVFFLGDYFPNPYFFTFIKFSPAIKRFLSVSVFLPSARSTTNHYLQGFPTIDLMKITGHKSERSFLKYIRISKLDAARRFNEHIKKKWGERVL
jgi:hypothetical protein